MLKHSEELEKILQQLRVFPECEGPHAVDIAEILEERLDQVLMDRASLCLVIGSGESELSLVNRLSTLIQDKDGTGYVFYAVSDPRILFFTLDCRWRRIVNATEAELALLADLKKAIKVVREQYIAVKSAPGVTVISTGLSKQVAFAKKNCTVFDGYGKQVTEAEAEAAEAEEAAADPVETPTGLDAIRARFDKLSERAALQRQLDETNGAFKRNELALRIKALDESMQRAGRIGIDYYLKEEVFNRPVILALWQHGGGSEIPMWHSEVYCNTCILRGISPTGEPMEIDTHKIRDVELLSRDEWENIVSLSRSGYVFPKM